MSNYKRIVSRRGVPYWLIAAVGCLAFAGVTSQAELRVGAARVDITPAPQAGDDPPTGKYEHEHLYVRAIVIDNGSTKAALIGADQGGMPEPVWALASKKIADELHCPVENIVMSATHTHSAGGFSRPPGGPRPAGAPTGPPQGGPPGGGPNAAPSPANTALANSILDAVRQAMQKLQPARVGYGAGLAYLNVNRDAINPETRLWTQAPNTDAASDKTVGVLKFVSLTGQPIAVYVNYAMHPINGYLAGFTSADFAGAMSRYVEDAYDDKVVVAFTQGASGDQNPLYMRNATNVMASRSGVTITGDELVRETVEQPLRDNKVEGKPADPKVRDRLERWMESEGDVLGEEVIRVMTRTPATAGTVRIWGKQEMVTCPGRRRTDSGREGMVGSYADGDPVNIRLGMLGIGNVAVTSVNAEIYTAISQRMKRQSPMANTMMVTLANGGANSGYIPDDASFSHNSFQVLSSRLKEGCAESAIADGLSKMVTEYQDAK